MIQGRTIQQVAQVLERQRETARDFVADTRAMALGNDGSSLLLDIVAKTERLGALNVNGWAHQQIGTAVGIPKPYYDRMRETAPALLAENVNHWFKAQPGTHVVRTIHDDADRRIVRAVCGSKYRPLDSYDLLEATLPEIIKAGCQIESAEVTERRLYVQAWSPRITGEVKKGDVVQAGIILSNSEVGSGSLSIQPLVFRLSCTNGMVMPDYGLKRRHVGRGHGGSEDQPGASEFFTDETRKADDRALFLKARDTVRGVLSESGFKKVLDKMRGAASDESTVDPVKLVERAAKRYDLSETESGSVMRHLTEGGDLTRWGLLNAVTRTAQDSKDYDRAVELERTGGMILEMPRFQWNEMAND